jgi:predicted nicotinamide N-methyase
MPQNWPATDNLAQPTTVHRQQVVTLRDQLTAAGRLRDVTLLLPRTGVTFELLQPDDIDKLLDDVVDDPEENLPYWAELWPSGIALAEAILQHPDTTRGRRAIEIGCGLGVTAIAALRSGADLVVCDYARSSLDLCRYNALTNAGREPQAIQLNWRRPSDEFLRIVGDGFPVVLAADVLYESRDVEPMLALMERVVGPGGLLWLAEPGRAVAGRFIELARSRGWCGEGTTHPGPWPDPRDTGVVVNLYRLRRGDA